MRKAASAPKLTEGQRRELDALEAEYDAPIDVSVAQILQEARELEAIGGKHGEALIKGSKLTKRDLVELSRRREVLEQAEAAWTAARLSTLPEGHHPSYDEADRLKKKAFAALRYFLAEDSGVQARLDAIVPGTGVADLVDDLSKLAALLDENASALAKASLPKKSSSLARDLARQLGEGAAEQAADTDALDASRSAQSLRNRAYWWLRELMDAIRAAGRYVFHDEPRKLALFRATSTRSHTRRASKPARPGPSKPA